MTIGLTSSFPIIPIRRFIRELTDGPFGSALTSAHYKDQGARVIRLGNIGSAKFKQTDEAYISLDYFHQLQRHQVMAGDLIIAGLGDTNHPVGRACLAPEGLGPAIVKADCFRARLDEGRLLHRYAAWALSSSAVSQQIRTLTRGTTRMRINLDIVREIQLPIPGIEEQRHIADFLDAETARIDHLISKFDRQRALVSEREKAALPLTVSGALLGDGQVDTGLPWFAKAHPQSHLVPLIRVLQLQRGVDLSDSQRRPGNVPVFTTAGPSGSHDRAIADAPGVVIGRYGSIGNVHWAENPYWPHNTTLYVKNFAGNDQRYCYHLLRALPYDMEQARAAVPGVNRNDLHKQLVPLVPRSLQKRVSRQADELAAWQHATHSRIERAQMLLDERRQALITAVVTGQFDLTTASGRNVTEGVSA